MSVSDRAEITDEDIARVREGFAALRVWCDPRGFGLLEALEAAAVTSIETFGSISRAVNELEKKVEEEGAQWTSRT